MSADVPPSSQLEMGEILQKSYISQSRDWFGGEVR